MPTWLVSILTIFAGPLGQLISAGMTAGGAAFTAWLLKTGVPVDSANIISSSAISIVGAIIHIFTGTQTVQMASINSSTTNGAKVVSASSPSPQVNKPNP